MTLIAIDGPAGAGKSTIARTLAERLSLARLDTGAMYRAVTLLVLEAGGDPTSPEPATELARAMSLDLDDTVLLNGRDVTTAIRSKEVDAAVSAVSAHPAVRSELVARQREWAKRHGGGVVEGRDIGSVVFPEADLKVFLTAAPAVRAKRRVRERAGHTGDEEGATELTELVRRDDLDSTRPVSPLGVAEGALVVDSTHLSVDEVVDEVLRHL